MSDEFNPYREWLGLEDGRWPSSHYELLGIANDEADRETIARTADALTARIRRIRPGAHVLAWQQLLDAVAQAKACLLDSTARAAYDSAVRQGSQPQAHLPEPGPAHEPGPPDGEPPAEASPAPSETFVAITDTTPDWLANAAVAVGPGSQPWSAAPMALDAPSQRVEPWLAAPLAGPFEVMPATPTVTLSPPDESPPPEAGAPQDSVDPGFAPAQGSYRATAPRRPSAAQWALRLMTIVVLGLAAVFVFLFVKQRQQTSPPPESVAVGHHGDPSRDVAGDGGPLGKPGGPSEPKSAKPGEAVEPGFRPAQPPKIVPSPAGQEKEPSAKTRPDEKPPAVEGPATRAPGNRTANEPLKQALAQVRGAMARRDLATARRQLKAAAQHVQGPADEAEVARVETLLANLEEFWKGMRQVVASLQPTQEIALGATPAIVVSADQDSFTYRSEGANHTYTLKDMPAPVVLALARSGFARSPSQKVLLGAFLAADAGGDPALARRLWDEAAQQGEDVTDLLPELSRPGAGPAAAKVDRKPPPADPVLLKKATEAVRLKYRAEFDQPTKAAAKAALARRLLDEGRADGLDPASRYVMFGEARSQAVAAGKAALACEAIDGLGAWFTIDPLALKVSTLEALAKSAVSIQGQREFVDASMKAALQAAQAQRPDDAQKLADLALAVARRSKNAALIRSVQAARQQIGSAPPGKAEDERQ